MISWRSKPSTHGPPADQDSSNSSAVARVCALHRNTMSTGNDCATRVMWGFGVGSALGASIGAMYGTYGAFKHRVPGLFKIRFVGQSTVQTGLAFGVFLAAGSFLQCGR